MDRIIKRCTNKSGSVSSRGEEKSVVETGRISRKEFINRFGFEGVHNRENSGESERLVPLLR